MCVLCCFPPPCHGRFVRGGEEITRQDKSLELACANHQTNGLAVGLARNSISGSLGACSATEGDSSERAA